MPNAVAHGALPVGVGERGGAAAAREVGAGEAADHRVVELDVPDESGAVAPHAAVDGREVRAAVSCPAPRA